MTSDQKIRMRTRPNGELNMRRTKLSELSLSVISSMFDLFLCKDLSSDNLNALKMLSVHGSCFLFVNAGKMLNSLNC